MNIDKYKNLTLEEYEKLISQDTIIPTEREITYKGITYRLNEDGYFNLTRPKTIRGYSESYSGKGKISEETESINRGIILVIQNLISILEESENDFNAFIEKK